MQRVVELLKQKNHFLEKFCALTEQEIKKFFDGNFESLEYFYQTREDILKMIKYIDESVNQVNMQTINQVASEEIKNQIEEQLNTKNQYVNRILSLDLEVLSCIEEAKSSIIKELQGLRKNKKAISGYKSGTTVHRLDDGLDEEI